MEFCSTQTSIYVGYYLLDQAVLNENVKELLADGVPGVPDQEPVLGDGDRVSRVPPLVFLDAASVSHGRSTCSFRQITRVGRGMGRSAGDRNQHKKDEDTSDHLKREGKDREELGAQR